MTTKTKSKKFLMQVAKNNDMKYSITDEYCAFGYDEENLQQGISNCVYSVSTIEACWYYVREYMFYAALGIAGAIDDWFDNATGLASIRFVLNFTFMSDSRVIVSDIYQQDVLKVFTLEEVLEDILGLKLGVDDLNDVDCSKLKKVVDSLSPADMLCIYYTTAKLVYEGGDISE